MAGDDDDDDEESDSEGEKSPKSHEKRQQVKKTKKKKPKTRAGRKKARLAKEKVAREAVEASKKRKQAKTALAFASLATDAVDDGGRTKQPVTRIAPHKTRTAPTTIGKPVAAPKKIHDRSPTVMAPPTTFGKTKPSSKQPLATKFGGKVTPTAFGGTAKPAAAVGTTFGSKFPTQTKIEPENGAKKMVSFIQNVDSEAEEDEAMMPTVSQRGTATQEQSTLPTVSQLGAKKTESSTKVGGATTAVAATSSEVLPTASQLATKMDETRATTAAGAGSTTETPLPTASQLATKMSRQTTASEGPLPTVSQLGAKSPIQEEAGGAEIEEGMGDGTLTVSQLASKTEVKSTNKHAKDFSKKIAAKKGAKTLGGENIDEEQTLGGKIMLCSCCCVCFLIFIGLSSLTGYLTHPYFIPLFKKTRKNGSAVHTIVARSSYDKLILNLHESCKEKYGPCSVFKEKYVDDCREVMCDTVTLVMDLKQKDKILPHDFRQTIRASFRLTNWDESQKVPVSDGTPCTYRTDNESSSRLVGSCRGGVCGPARDRAFLRYYARSPIHGNWSNYETYSEKNSCLKLPKDIDMSSVAKLCTPNGPCSPYQYVFRSCTSPHPLFGGRYCWSADGTVSSPVTLALCPQCPEHTKKVADWPIDCGRAKLLYKDRCAMTHYGSLRKSKGRIFHTDFKTCCPEEAIKDEHRGRCLFGNCWIATKIV